MAFHLTSAPASPCSSLRGADEFLRIPDPLHIEHNALRIRVIAQEIDQVPEIDIDHRAEGCKEAEADMSMHGPVEDGAPQGPALGDEGDPPRFRTGFQKRGVESTKEDMKQSKGNED